MLQKSLGHMQLEVTVLKLFILIIKSFFHLPFWTAPEKAQSKALSCGESLNINIVLVSLALNIFYCCSFFVIKRMAVQLKIINLHPSSLSSLSLIVVSIYSGPTISLLWINRFACAPTSFLLLKTSSIRFVHFITWHAAHPHTLYLHCSSQDTYATIKAIGNKKREKRFNLPPFAP